MKIISIGGLKTHFSKVLKNVESGEKIAITFGKKKEMKPRKLGVLDGKGNFFLRGDFNITTDQEFPIH